MKALILDNVMAPGHQALEAELALRFGVSRTPVREALLRLQAESFVQLEPRRGMRVLPISPEEMGACVSATNGLAPAPAGLAAKRRARAWDGATMTSELRVGHGA